MKSMDKISTGIAYGTSAGSAGYWFLQLLDRVTPSQWAAIGVLGNDSNLLIVFYVQIMPDDFVMQLHRF